MKRLPNILNLKADKDSCFVSLRLNQKEESEEMQLLDSESYIRTKIQIITMFHSSPIKLLIHQLKV